MNNELIELFEDRDFAQWLEVRAGEINKKRAFDEITVAEQEELLSNLTNLSRMKSYQTAQESKVFMERALRLLKAIPFSVLK
jgi:hypothetical protein